jgi:LAS superfamily LD-carboxypeptidase LdcB
MGARVRAEKARRSMNGSRSIRIGRRCALRRSMSVSVFMSRAKRLVPLAIVLTLVGCAVEGEAPPTSGDEPITQEEAAAGEAWSAGDGAEPDDHVDDGQALGSPVEDSARHIAPDSPIFDEESAPIDPGEFEETFACQKATGYRRGKAFTICVTSVDGKLVEVNTARSYLKMKAAAKKSGVYLYVVSGFRTMAKQRELYRLYKQGKGNLAAPPGYSNHQSGKALDLNTSAKGVYYWLTKHGSAYGFRRTVPSEKWHWER